MDRPLLLKVAGCVDSANVAVAFAAEGHARIPVALAHSIVVVIDVCLLLAVASYSEENERQGANDHCSSNAAYHATDNRLRIGAKIASAPTSIGE